MLSTEQNKTQFKKATRDYYTTLEEVTVSIRREIRLLSNVSKDKVLPISLVPKAEWVGKVKEAEVWKNVEAQLRDKPDTAMPDSTAPPPTETPAEAPNAEEAPKLEPEGETAATTEAPVEAEAPPTTTATVDATADASETKPSPGDAAEDDDIVMED